MNLAKIFLSVGGIGFLPLMPGTFGSIVGVLLSISLPFFLRIPVFIALFLVSVLCIHLYRRQLPKSDPSWIVIDEVAGQMIPFALIDDSSWFFILSSFILFRIFDISKIGIIGWTESYFEKNQNTWSLGIMLDDVLAGLCAALLIKIVLL